MLEPEIEDDPNAEPCGDYDPVFDLRCDKPTGHPDLFHSSSDDWEFMFTWRTVPETAALVTASPGHSYNLEDIDCIPFYLDGTGMPV